MKFLEMLKNILHTLKKDVVMLALKVNLVDLEPLKLALLLLKLFLKFSTYGILRNNRI